MMKRLWLCSAAVALASPALAQNAPPAPSAVAASEAASGILVFAPDFFADARPDTVLDMLSRLPGFSLNFGDSGTRGYAGAGGNVLVDGQRPAIKSESLDQYLRRISAESVERIELIRGGAPGIDMQGQAVVANIVLRSTVTTQTVIEFNPYLYQTGYVGPMIRAQYSRREGEAQEELSFSASSDLRVDLVGEGFRRRYDASGALIQDIDLELDDHIQYANLAGSIQRPLGENLVRVNGLLNYFENTTGQTLTLVSGTGQDERNEQHFRGLDGELGLRWTRPLGPRTDFEATALQRLAQNEFQATLERGAFDSLFTSDETSGETIGRALARFRPDDRWAFEGGGEAAYNFLDGSTTYAENGTPIALPSASVLVEELRAEVFGQATWRPRPSLTVEAGLRVEFSEISQSGDTDRSKTFTYPKPRLLVTWSPAEGHQFRFRYERRVGQLDFGDFVASSEVTLGQVTAGNPDLVPFQADTLEAVYERRFWEEGVFELQASHTEYRDYIGVIPLVGGFDAVGNIGDGSQDLFQARLTLPLDRIGVENARLQVRGTWTESEIVDPVTGRTVDFPGSDGFGCGVAYNHDLQGGRWSYGFDHGCDNDAGYNYRTRELRYVDNEPFLTLYGQWKPRDDLTVRLEIGNATTHVLHRERWVYTGVREASPLSFHEVQESSSYPWFFLQIRKVL
ncbi:TonB-dependent receptor [Brevundimonas sp. 2R-24]|uniref:TonB-dependent receptor n=1 Tax=Peiella sedimenti TaxID=3061083 RepID=A0ABT8SJP5_9CAUL|nr:TonB-dependent receptor [Caulobacteraceae bacterium XZ-24]